MGQYYTVTIAETQESYRCLDERSVLQGMEALGKKGIPVGCRQGGCGVCKVHVLEGSYDKRVMSRLSPSLSRRISTTPDATMKQEVAGRP